MLLSTLCARNSVVCSLLLLRLAAKQGPRCSFSQPCRRGRRSTRYSRNNLGVAARNFAALEERNQHSCCSTSRWCCLHMGSCGSTELEQYLWSSLYPCKGREKQCCSKSHHFPCTSASPVQKCTFLLTVSSVTMLLCPGVAWDRVNFPASIC